MALAATDPPLPLIARNAERRPATVTVAAVLALLEAAALAVAGVILLVALSFFRDFASMMLVIAGRPADATIGAREFAALGVLFAGSLAAIVVAGAALSRARWAWAGLLVAAGAGVALGAFRLLGPLSFLVLVIAIPIFPLLLAPGARAWFRGASAVVG